MLQQPPIAAVATYASWFPAPACVIHAGEWTPDYLVHCWLGPMLQQMAPAAKVVVMLRDPVERYRRRGQPRMTPHGVPHAVESSELFTGRYAEHLARIEPFVDDDDRLLVLQYERCALEPESELARTFEFLGVEPSAVTDPPAPDLDGQPPDGKEPFELSAERRATVVESYRPDVERLGGPPSRDRPRARRNFG